MKMSQWVLGLLAGGVAADSYTYGGYTFQAPPNENQGPSFGAPGTSLKHPNAVVMGTYVNKYDDSVPHSVADLPAIGNGGPVEILFADTNPSNPPPNNGLTSANVVGSNVVLGYNQGGNNPANTIISNGQTTLIQPDGMPTAVSFASAPATQTLSSNPQATSGTPQPTFTTIYTNSSTVVSQVPGATPTLSSNCQAGGPAFAAQFDEYLLDDTNLTLRLGRCPDTGKCLDYGQNPWNSNQFVVYPEGGKVKWGDKHQGTDIATTDDNGDNKTINLLYSGNNETNTVVDSAENQVSVSPQSNPGSPVVGKKDGGCLQVSNYGGVSWGTQHPKSKKAAIGTLSIAAGGATLWCAGTRFIGRAAPGGNRAYRWCR